MDIQLEPNAPIAYFQNDFSVDTYINSLSLYVVFNILASSTGRQGRKYPIKLDCSLNGNLGRDIILNYIQMMRKQFVEKINHIEVNQAEMTLDGYFRAQQNSNTLIKQSFSIDSSRQVQFFVRDLIRAQNQFYERAQKVVGTNMPLNNEKDLGQEMAPVQSQSETREKREKRKANEKKKEKQLTSQILQRMRQRDQVWSESLSSTYSEYERKMLKQRNKNRRILEEDSQNASLRESENDEPYIPYKNKNVRMRYMDTKKIYEQIFIPIIVNQWVDLKKIKNPNDATYDHSKINLQKKNVYLFGKKIKRNNQVIKVRGIQNVRNFTIGICDAKYGPEFVLDPFLFPNHLYFSTKGRYFNGETVANFEEFSVPTLDNTAIEMRVNLKGLKITWTYLNGKRCSFDKIVLNSRQKIQWAPFIYFADSFSKAEIGI